MPRVSIIIPLYNKEKYIKNTIEYLLAQTYSDYELIIIDDGSTDNSAVIALDFNIYPQINVIQVKNGGVSSARNIGLDYSSGEWIWFIDADDLPDKQWLSCALPYMLDSNIDIIMGDFVRRRDEKDDERVSICANGNITEKSLAELILSEQRKTGYFGYLWNKLVRRSFIDKANARFQPGLALAEDLKFMTALYECDPQCFVLHEVSMIYNVETMNSSKEKEIDYTQQLDIWCNLYAYIEGCGVFEATTEKKRVVSIYVACVFFYEYEKSHTITNGIQWIESHPEYTSMLEANLLDGLNRRIVLYVQKKHYRKLNRVLKIRMIIRNVYRRIRQ